MPYEGGRSEEAFVAYLNEQCGTHRAVGGGLNDQVCSGIVLVYLVVYWFDITGLGWAPGGIRRVGRKILRGYWSSTEHYPPGSIPYRFHGRREGQVLYPCDAKSRGQQRGLSGERI